ncbi:hypothetical protein [Luteibacter sp. 22Crub2.1]|uniref:hypothetical protein n=1 Tax=Luteibacter sp. 22Crub2.1 TaxID=1283288 RepID=UPI0009A7CAF2|nr:hypothetical protein [Luteibacter sp. 22Crub2.1]SKC03820.1 hypothetical protein SAMN05660880_03872 [Luteibacter sp. 22Crub2.1]
MQREASIALGDDRVGSWSNTAASALGNTIGTQTAKALNQPTPQPAKAENPLDAWRRDVGDSTAYDNLGPAGHSVDPTDLLGAYNRQGVASLASRDPSFGVSDETLAEVAYGSRADWIAYTDTSDLGTPVNGAYSAKDLGHSLRA